MAAGRRDWYSCSRFMLKPFVIVSSRLRIVLATIVQAASSAVSRLALCLDSPTCSSFRRLRRDWRGSCKLGVVEFEQHVRSPPLWERATWPAGTRSSMRCLSDLASHHHAFGQLARGLDVSRVVHEHQSLQRRVGARAAHGAGFPVRRVKGATASAAARFVSKRCTSLRR